jgi:hypothetical protein
MTNSIVRNLVAALVTGFAGWQSFNSQCLARSDQAPDSGYSGVEFYGSSQVSRSELEKELGLKPGANLTTTLKAARRLQDKLEKRRLEAHIDIAEEGANCFVSVDIVEPGVSSAPAHKLISPHRVYLTNDMPFTIFDQLTARLTQLSNESRPAIANYTAGVKMFSDEPCNQYANKLVKVVPAMRAQFLEMVASDPDPGHRSKATEVLNWDVSSSAADCLALIPALEDTSLQVRGSADRYILPRISLLPDNFPIQDLVEALSHQLSRPSHIDRTMALQGLLELSRRQPFTIGAIKVADEEKLKQLAEQSLLSSVKQPARNLLDAFNHLPEPPKEAHPVHINEF